MTTFAGSRLLSAAAIVGRRTHQSSDSPHIQECHIMQLNRYAAAAFALMAVAGSAEAQKKKAAREEPSPISWGMALGASVPTGDLSTYSGTGFRMQGQMNYAMPDAPVSLRAELGYDQFADKTIPGGPTTSQNAFSGVGSAVLPFGESDQLKPYAIAGLGLYHQNGSVKSTGNPTFSDSQNNLGFNIGVGSGFTLGSMNAFVEARLHMVLSGAVDVNGAKTSANYMPITFGINF
ncbi:MAG: hypothetical protein NVS9B3_09430 [Gemmatimonadaceae bacterium]